MKPEISEIAAQHIHTKNRENPYSDIMRWVLTNPQPCVGGYLYEYEFEMLKPNKQGAFGGAPAFFISTETGELKDVDWNEYNELKKQ